MLEARRQKLISVAFDYYRSNGFPYPQMTYQDLWGELYDLEDIELNITNPQGYLFQEMLPKELEIRHNGINVPNFFNRHIWSSYAVGMRSPLEAFNDDKALRKAIRLALDTTGQLTDTSVRNKLKIVNGTQMCSNFRPSAAKAIYQRYGHNSTFILDPSAGYGGRLFGFLASGLNAHYIGIDPSSKSCQGNQDMAGFFGRDETVDLLCEPFEDVCLDDYPPFDLAFTSPPYFKKEVYSDEDTQSSARYPSYRIWLDCFWFTTIHKVFEHLRPGAYFIVNIQDVTIKSKIYPLTDDTLWAANLAGFRLADKLQMLFSGFGANLDKFKGETVFIFEKPS